MNKVMFSKKKNETRKVDVERRFTLAQVPIAKQITAQYGSLSPTMYQSTIIVI